MTDQHVQPRSEPKVPEQRTARDTPAPKHRARLPQPEVSVPPRPPSREPAFEPRVVRQRRATRLAMVLPLALGALGVWAATTAGISLLTTHHERTTHSFTLAASAAGMTRDPTQEAAYADQVSGVEDNFQLQFMGRLSQFVTAVYDNPTATTGRPAGSVVFVGAAIDTHGNPRDFVSTFARQATTAGATVTTVNVGDGALGVCSQSTATPSVTSCAWSTGDAVGQLVPTVNGWDSVHLGTAMTQFRAAMETSSTR